MIDDRSKKIYLISAVITAVVFFSGIGLGFWVNKGNVEILEEDLKELESDIRQEQTNLRLVKALPERKCKLLRLKMEDLIKKVGKFQNKVEYFENNKKLNSPDYKKVKRRYMGLLIEHWLLFKDLRKECGREATVIFYFYTKPCSKCIDQGVILTNFKQKKEENLVIYPFDMHLNVSSLDLLAKAYNINKYPSIVINSEYVHEGFIGKSKLKRVLKNRTSLYE